MQSIILIILYRVNKIIIWFYQLLPKIVVDVKNMQYILNIKKQHNYNIQKYFLIQCTISNLIIRVNHNTKNKNFKVNFFFKILI